jgi:hypothetical protein
MQLTDRELWAVIHVSLRERSSARLPAGLVGLWSLKERYLTAAGLAERMPRFPVGGCEAIARLTVTGTLIVARGTGTAEGTTNPPITWLAVAEQ